MRFTFDHYELDADRRALFRQGEPVHLSPKAYALLELLLEEAPKALSKKDLIDALWPDTIVEEGSLTSLIAELRAALGDRRTEARFVRTVHGYGYAFCGEPARSEGPRRVATLHYNGEEIPLFEGATTLGRDPSAGVLIDHETVSRRHATLTVTAGSATLEDLSSKNGTFVDERRLTAPAALEHGATFVLGDARVVFRRVGMMGTTVTRGRH